MYIGIDLGTTICKAAAYDESGALQGEYRREYQLITNGGFIEQDANEWWRMAQEALAKLGGKAVAISAQGISFVPVDREGNPLCNAITWLDRRAGEELQLLADRFGEEVIYQKTGKPMSASYTLPKLMWLKKNRPEIYERTYKFLMPLDFLNFKLTGNAVTDYTMASGTMLFNLRDKCWDSELLRFAGISVDKLPEVMCMGTEIGSGVILGGQDQKLAAIGAGIAKGVCTVSIGTATAITKLDYMPEDNLPLFVFDDDHIAAEYSVAATGAMIKWLSGILGADYAEMDAMAEKAASGVKFDLSGDISGLTLATKKGDIVRALYEGICREIKIGIEKLGGAEEIRVFGGGSKSEILCRILGDVKLCNTAETAALGAAMLASGYKIKAEVN